MEFDFTLIFLSILLILSGLFSGSEVALLSLSDGKVHAMVEEKLSGALSVKELKDNPNKMLITILIGNNLVNIGASVLTTAWATKTFGSEILGVITGVLTILILIFGEIFPKVFAQRYAENVSRIIAKPLLIISYIFYPIIILLELLLEFAMKFAGKDKEASKGFLSEIKALTKLASNKGYIGDRSKDIISNSLFFTNIKAKDVMTLEPQVLMIDINSPLEILKGLFIQYGYSRIPVYKKEMNVNVKIVGIINMQMYLEAEHNLKTNVNQIDFIQPLIVKDDLELAKILTKLQSIKQQMVIVVDKDDKFSGILTIENILEEIVGEMFDEKERDENFIRVIDENNFYIKFDCTLFDFRKHFENFESEYSNFKSIGNFFIKNFKDDLKVGAKLKRDNYIIEIYKMKRGDILLFKVTKL